MRVLLALALACPAFPEAAWAGRLFNGKNLKGWTALSADPSKKADDIWSVDKGVLVCKGLPMGYLRTAKLYMNFILSLEWRFAPGQAEGNSGVLLRAQGPDKVWPRSLEAQLRVGQAGDLWAVEGFQAQMAADRTRGRRGMRMSTNQEKPPGQWNSLEARVLKGRMDLFLNGELVNSATDLEGHPGFIAFQAEGAEVHFRNIYLKELR
jgi:hypothetical protein